MKGILAAALLGALALSALPSTSLAQDVCSPPGTYMGMYNGLPVYAPSYSYPSYSYPTYSTRSYYPSTYSYYSSPYECPAPTTTRPINGPSVIERSTFTPSNYTTRTGNRATFYIYDVPSGAAVYVSNGDETRRMTEECNDGAYYYDSPAVERGRSFSYTFTIVTSARVSYRYKADFMGGDRKNIRFRDFTAVATTVPSRPVPSGPKVIEDPPPRPPVAPGEETRTNTPISIETRERDRSTFTPTNAAPREKPPVVIEVIAGRTTRVDLKDKIKSPGSWSISDRAPDWITVHPRGMMTLTPAVSDAGETTIMGSVIESKPNEENIGLFKLKIVVKP